MEGEKLNFFDLSLWQLIGFFTSLADYLTTNEIARISAMITFVRTLFY